MNINRDQSGIPKVPDSNQDSDLLLEEEERAKLLREAKGRSELGVLLNVRHTAVLVGLSEPAIRRWVLERRIPFVKIGTRVLFDPEELGEYIDQRRVPATK